MTQLSFNPTYTLGDIVTTLVALSVLWVAWLALRNSSYKPAKLDIYQDEGDKSSIWGGVRWEGTVMITNLQSTFGIDNIGYATANIRTIACTLIECPDFKYFTLTPSYRVSGTEDGLKETLLPAGSGERFTILLAIQSAPFQKGSMIDEFIKEFEEISSLSFQVQLLVNFRNGRGSTVKQSAKVTIKSPQEFHKTTVEKIKELKTWKD